MRRAAALLLVPICSAHVLAAQGLPFHAGTALTTSFEQHGLRAFTMLQQRGEMTASVTPLVVLPFAPHQRVTTKVTLPVVYKRMDGVGGLAGT